MELERVFDMAHPDPLAAQDHADHVEPVVLAGPPVTVDPGERGTGQLALLPPADGPHRPAESVAAPRLHLDERDGPLALRYEVDVAPPAAEAMLHDSPAAPREPPCRHALPELPECLPGR